MLYNVFSPTPVLARGIDVANSNNGKRGKWKRRRRESVRSANRSRSSLGVTSETNVLALTVQS